ncbi:MAG: GerMN domain-containing protein [candidate division SR1 bacterium]|nr:GerMN domain-containing protein [candidate division SR1 bacterium]
MKKILIVLLIIINILVLIGLSGLVFYQFKQILDRDNQINVLSSKISNNKTVKPSTKSDSSTAITQSSLQIKDNGQQEIFNLLKKNKEGQAIVNIFFLKDSQDKNTIFSLERLSDRQDILTFSLEELIKGPTPAELTKGIISPIVLSGISNCGGDNFTLFLSNGTATVKMCKVLSNSANSSSEQIRNSIELTTKQFSEVKKVIILNSNNTCFGDSSSQDSCKNI